MVTMVTMMPLAHEAPLSGCRLLTVMSARASLETQLHAEYRSLVAALGPWAKVFDLRDTPSAIKVRGPAESAIFRSGDVTVYRFGPSLMVHRTLSGWTEAYFMLRETTEGVKLVRRGFIGSHWSQEDVAKVEKTLKHLSLVAA
jgi:hypothetical protein